MHERASAIEIRHTLSFDKKIFSFEKARVYYLRREMVYEDKTKSFEVLEVLYDTGSNSFNNLRYLLEDNKLIRDSELKLRKNLAGIISREVKETAGIIDAILSREE